MRIARPLYPPLLAATVALVACISVPSARSDMQGVRLVRPPVAFGILHDSPDILVIDLRTPVEFQGASGHLEGAVNIPLEELAGRMAELRAVVGETILVYCRDDPCGLAGVRILQAHGFDYVFLLEGGMPAWVAGGFRRAAQDLPDA